MSLCTICNEKGLVLFLRYHSLDLVCWEILLAVNLYIVSFGVKYRSG